MKEPPASFITFSNVRSKYTYQSKTNTTRNLDTSTFIINPLKTKVQLIVIINHSYQVCRSDMIPSKICQPDCDRQWRLWTGKKGSIWTIIVLINVIKIKTTKNRSYFHSACTGLLGRGHQLKKRRWQIHQGGPDC